MENKKRNLAIYTIICIISIIVFFISVVGVKGYLEKAKNQTFEYKKVYCIVTKSSAFSGLSNETDIRVEYNNKEYNLRHPEASYNYIVSYSTRAYLWEDKMFGSPDKIWLDSKYGKIWSMFFSLRLLSGLLFLIMFLTQLITIGQYKRLKKQNDITSMWN